MSRCVHSKVLFGKFVAGHLLPDYFHMMIPIPRKCSVAAAMWYIKVKSVIRIACDFLGLLPGLEWRGAIACWRPIRA